MSDSRKLTILVAVVAAMLSNSAARAEPPAIKEFCQSIRLTHMTCLLEQRVLMAGGSLPVAGQDKICLQTYAETTRPPYDAAVKAGPAGMVKDIYADFLSRVRQVGPKAGETRNQYEARLVDDMEAIGTACSRLALETD